MSICIQEIPNLKKLVHRNSGIQGRYTVISKFTDREQCVHCLHQIGFGKKVLIQKTGVPGTTLKRWRVQWGKPDQKRTAASGSIVKAPIETLTADERDLLRWGFKQELKALRKGDESRHWGEHPTVLKWGYSAYWRANKKRIAKRNKNDPKYKIKKALRHRLYFFCKGTRREGTSTLLGCSYEFFRRWIEGQFDRKMTWDNYGDYWHIDHVLPCASFDLTSAEGRSHCFHYTNLQPLEASENRRKRATVMPTQLQILINIPKENAA